MIACILPLAYILYIIFTKIVVELSHLFKKLFLRNLIFNFVMDILVYVLGMILKRRCQLKLRNYTFPDLKKIKISVMCSSPFLIALQLAVATFPKSQSQLEEEPE
jgi:hypothetical protein